MDAKQAKALTDKFEAVRAARTKQIANDPRPKTEPLTSLPLRASAREHTPRHCKSLAFETDGTARIKRLDPAQQVAFTAWLEDCDFDGTLTNGSRVTLAKIAQRAIVHTDRTSLLLPGAEGEPAFTNLPDDELERIAFAVLRFNELMEAPNGQSSTNEDDADSDVIECDESD